MFQVISERIYSNLDGVLDEEVQTWWLCWVGFIQDDFELEFVQESEFLNIFEFLPKYLNDDDKLRVLT